MKANGTEQVKLYLDELKHPLKDLILQVRKAVLSSDKRLTEHIKWNAPSFCIEGDDRITMKLFPPKEIQLVFHRGSKKKQMPAEHLIDDDGSLLKWVANDRAVAGFRSQTDLNANKSQLKKLIILWIEAGLEE